MTDDVAQLIIDRVAELERERAGFIADVATLRELLSAALDALHTLQEQNDRLRVCLRRDLGRIADAAPERRAA